MNPRLRHRARVLKYVFPDCYREVDGYWVWGPREIAGCWTAADLHVIAELLDEANRKWDAEIREYFDSLDNYEPVELNVDLCVTEHREPAGPNEDIAQCPRCYLPTYTMRPADEQIGLHLDDCSLDRDHESYCVGGGNGHAPKRVVRGYWLGMEDDIKRARERHS